MGIAQYFSTGFYEANTSQPTIGSIYWAPVAEINECPTIFQAQRASPTDHEVTQFAFVQLGSQHFKAEDILPIKQLNLDDHSELMVHRAKKRPCVVLAIGGIGSTELASISHPEQARRAKVLAKAVYLLAPMYGCSTAQEKGCFGPIVTNRIRALKYPHLCYFPPFDPAKSSSDPGSILRLDMTFAAYLGRGCDSHDFKVKDEVMDVLQDQFKIICGMEPSDDFLEIKQLVEECLPET